MRCPPCEAPEVPGQAPPAAPRAHTADFGTPPPLQDCPQRGLITRNVAAPPCRTARSRRQPPPSCDSVRRAQGARPGLASWRPVCCPSCFSCGRAAQTRLGGARHHWQLVPATLCKSKQNKTHKKHCSAQSASDKNAPPQTQPPLVPTLRAPQKEGAQARQPMALAQCVAVAVARPGSHAGLRHQQPPALHGSRQSARRAACSPPGGRGHGGAEVGARVCAGGRAWEPPRASPFSAARGLT